jgi:hypothetical protein
MEANYLFVADLCTEQRSIAQRLRRHLRYLHGWGVLYGLQVVPARRHGQSWAVQVCPGYAISCCGDEIVVPKPAMVDVYDYMWRQPLSPHPARTAYVGIRYAEEETRPVPTITAACGDGDLLYRPSRIRDGFQVDVLWTLPTHAGPARPAFCEPHLEPCPECSDSPYVILAQITLPATDGESISSAEIENWSVRQPP